MLRRVPGVVVVVPEDQFGLMGMLWLVGVPCMLLVVVPVRMSVAQVIFIGGTTMAVVAVAEEYVHGVKTTQAKSSFTGDT